MRRIILISIALTTALISHCQNTEEQSLLERINSYMFLSDSCSKIEDYEAALDYKIRELQLRKHFNQIDRLAKCGERLGLIYYHLGKYHYSLSFFERAASFYKKTGDHFSYATLKVNEANVYTRLGKYPQAIRHMRMAESVYAEDTFKYANQLVGLYANLGLAYFDLPHLDSAQYFYDLAQRSNEIANRPEYNAVLLNNKGDIYLAKGNLDKAKEYFNASLKLASELNYSLLIATSKLNLATVQTKRKNFDEAILNLNEALLIYQNVNSLYFLAETNIALSDCYEEMGDHENALYYLKQYNHLEDSLKGAETLDRIANLEMEVALEDEKQRFAIVQKEKELAETKSEHQRTYLYLMIALVVLGTAVAFLLIKGLRTSLEKNRLKAEHLQQKHQLLQNELDFKKKEIENFSTYILEKNQILNQLKEKLVEIKKEKPDSNTIHDAIQTVNHNLHIDQDRKELDLKIDQAHQEFMGRLLEKHPKLTKTEQRLCSLLLMDLSTKDISQIMNVEPESAKKSRSRLRKKLDLEPKSDLTEFLKTI